MALALPQLAAMTRAVDWCAPFIIRMRLHRPWRGGGAAAAGLMLTLALGVTLWGDPGRAYAVARIRLPEMPRSAMLTPALGVETPTASRPAPRPILREGSRDPMFAEGASLAAHAASPSRTADRGQTLDGDALAAAPIAGLTRPGPGGLLPNVGADGLRAADAYARPFSDDSGASLIAIVIGGLGLNAEVTREAIETLPPEVTLSFVPYADNLQAWIDAARAAGHETVLELPMEPYDYPANDPGPHTLLARADPVENSRRLNWLMSRATGYFAVMNYLGARFTAEPAALQPVLESIAGSGVAFLYDGETRRADLEPMAVHADLDIAAADRILDAQPDAAAIDEQLLHLEALAIQNGHSIGAGFGYPVTVRQARAWAPTLQLKGYRLAPVSAVLALRAEASRLRVAEAGAVAPLARPSFSAVPASFGGGEEGASGGHGGASGGAGH
jgi:polysaccharide deacetylase 2 family uncharacterized protein YibQ